MSVVALKPGNGINSARQPVHVLPVPLAAVSDDLLYISNYLSIDIPALFDRWIWILWKWKCAQIVSVWPIFFELTSQRHIQFCLGGCNPLASHSLDSCMPEPVCQNANHTFTDNSRILPNSTDFDGNATQYGKLVPDITSERYRWAHLTHRLGLR